MSQNKSKLERRYIAISRILRKRNYGFVKVIRSYQNLIFNTTFTKSDIDEIARDIYKSYTAGRSTESLKDMFDKLDAKVEGLRDKLKKIFKTLLLQGSRKVFNNKGEPLELGIPNYDKVIDRLTENNLKYIKNISELQRDAIIKTISQGVKDGKSYAAMRDDLLANVEGLTATRAKLIASNEAHDAHVKAMTKTMTDNGIEKYQWLTANDDRVSDICRSLHRHVFKFGETGTMTWKDIKGKAYTISKSPKPIHSSHVNCRCVIVAIVD
jgi:SPP1 gp7 family putative phage head morphogenesis protein